MKTSLRFLVVPFLVLFSLAVPDALHAQATKLFVSASGNDASAGGPTTPKRTLQAAENAVVAGGEIVVLDTAGYGTLTITKSVSITVPPGVNGFVTATGNTNGIAVLVAASDHVALRGLIVEGPGIGAQSTGIYLGSAGTTTVEDCTVHDFDFGIATDTNNLVIVLVANNCSIRNVQTGFYHASAGTAIVTGCRVDNASNVAVDGYAASATAGYKPLTLSHCILTNSNVAVTATNAIWSMDNCTISHNTTGTTDSSPETPQGGVVSFGNNTFSGNGSDGVFYGSASTK